MGARTAAVGAALTIASFGGALYETSQAFDDWNAYNELAACASAKYAANVACRDVFTTPAILDGAETRAEVETGIAIGAGVLTVVCGIGAIEMLDEKEDPSHIVLSAGDRTSIVVSRGSQAKKQAAASEVNLQKGDVGNTTR